MMTSQMITGLLALAAAVGVASTASADGHPSSSHPVVAELVDVGLKLAAGDDGEAAIVKLTPPLLRARMTPDEQQSAMEDLLGANRLDRYLADKVVTPQYLRVKTEKKLGEAGTIRRLDQYFVVYGDLELIRDEGLLEDFMAKEKKEQGPAKFEQYMERRDTPADGEPVDPAKPYLYRYRLPLLDKVVMSGLIRGQSVSPEGMLIESAVSAEDLLDDEKDPTVWQAMPRQAEGDEDLGPPTPYRGLAGYLQVTELGFKPGALLVECHGVLVEPTGWFDGRNLLASKLPAVAQENMRSFRRKLARAMEDFRAKQAAGE